MKTKRFNVRVSEKEKAELCAVSDAMDIPAALIIREAVKEKIAELKKRMPQTDKATALAS